MTELQALTRQRLEERGDQAQFTVLKRIGADRRSVLTGSALLARAARLHAAWRDQLGPGPLRLVLALPPGESFLVALVASLLHGVTVTPVAPPRAGGQAERFRHIVRDSGACALLGTPQTAAALVRHLSADGAEPLPCHVLAMTPEGGAETVAEAADRAGWARDDAPPAVVQYTSGSTRFPKGVLIHPEQVLANSDLVRRCWRLGPGTRNVNWLPHYHDMGLMGGIVYPLLMGVDSVQMNPLDAIRDPGFWLRAVSDHRATTSGAPAFAYRQCLDRIDDAALANLDLSSWTTAFCGAEPIPAGLLDAFRDRFAACGLDPNAVFACYGMAEFTLFASGQHEDGARPEGRHGDTHPSRLSPLTAPGVAVVSPETGAPLPEGRQGEVWLAGPSRGTGYANLPAETAEAFGARRADGADGWLRTGDLGVIADGWLYVTGRIKDMLISNGRNIAASEIEWLACAQAEGLNPFGAAVFPIRHGADDQVVLLVELAGKDDTVADPEATFAAMRRAVLGEYGIRLAHMAILRRGTLERTSSGKIRRAAIAQAWRDGRPPPADDITAQSGAAQTAVSA
ncbi:AMP-binding protein [Rhodobacteraceae bacterium 2CG4]|uniref:AMP-binding protein n=1 Tax=Halovulum marinum TaxID=2662447 RepID=A0A6L5Z531_9RHOB|nr:AMP-binding protein [Halovulum marinum]MSU91688.1 AMP-binding protein [Halovulum marinum]